MKILEILNFLKIFELEKVLFFMQIYPVSEGYLRKIPVEKRGKYPESLFSGEGHLTVLETGIFRK